MASLLQDITIAAGGAAALSSLFAVAQETTIGAITVQATISEDYDDGIETTDQPVEKGADITDHAYVRPTRLTLRCGWSNSGLQQLIGAASDQSSSQFHCRRFDDRVRLHIRHLLAAAGAAAVAAGVYGDDLDFARFRIS